MEKENIRIGLPVLTQHWSPALLDFISSVSLLSVFPLLERIIRCLEPHEITSLYQKGGDHFFHQWFNVKFLVNQPFVWHCASHRGHINQPNPQSLSSSPPAYAQHSGNAQTRHWSETPEYRMKRHPSDTNPYFIIITLVVS